MCPLIKSVRENKRLLLTDRIILDNMTVKRKLSDSVSHSTCRVIIKCSTSSDDTQTLSGVFISWKSRLCSYLFHNKSMKQYKQLTEYRHEQNHFIRKLKYRFLVYRYSDDTSLIQFSDFLVSGFVSFIQENYSEQYLYFRTNLNDSLSQQQTCCLCLHLVIFMKNVLVYVFFKIN